ncbi:MAG: hypothetical protein C0629_10070 [Chromatiales bacterium]|nr:MAG: hypothetical protein C0629_10070 [Chromatiales bacterium]
MKKGAAGALFLCNRCGCGSGPTLVILPRLPLKAAGTPKNSYGATTGERPAVFVRQAAAPGMALRTCLEIANKKAIV